MIKNSHLVIGRLELVDLPDLGIERIEAKIDTGAFTSSLHCHKIHIFEKNNTKYVRFNLLDPAHPAYNEKLFELVIHDIRPVKSSNGISEDRVFIKTMIRFFDTDFEIQFSLTDRSEMKYPLLVGRKFLKGKFLVDVSKKNLSVKK